MKKKKYKVFICQPDYVHSHLDKFKQQDVQKVLEVIEQCLAYGHEYAIVDLNIQGHKNSFDCNKFKNEVRRLCRWADICVCINKNSWSAMSARSYCYPKRHKLFLEFYEYKNNWLYDIF